MKAIRSELDERVAELHAMDKKLEAQRLAQEQKKADRMRDDLIAEKTNAAESR